MLVVMACGDNTPGTVVDAPLGSEPLAPAALSASPDFVDFGVGAIAYEVFASVTVTNVGLTVSGPVLTSITGSEAVSFAPVSTTCTTLAPGATCTVSLKFAPSSVGAKRAWLHLTADPGGIETVTLDGTALAGTGSVFITPSSYQFGTLPVGTPSAPETLTVSWNGLGSTGALTLLPGGGSHPGDFALTNDACSGVSLASGSSCTFAVQFTATLAGARTAVFVVTGSPGGTASASTIGFGE